MKFGYNGADIEPLAMAGLIESVINNFQSYGVNCISNGIFFIVASQPCHFNVLRCIVPEGFCEINFDKVALVDIPVEFGFGIYKIKNSKHLDIHKSNSYGDFLAAFFKIIICQINLYVKLIYQHLSMRQYGTLALSQIDHIQSEFINVISELKLFTFYDHLPVVMLAQYYRRTDLILDKLIKLSGARAVLNNGLQQLYFEFSLVKKIILSMENNNV